MCQNHRKYYNNGILNNHFSAYIFQFLLMNNINFPFLIKYLLVEEFIDVYSICNF